MKHIILLVFLFSKVYSSVFDNEFNHHDYPISQLKVCGERCSGTNFVYYLLHYNFPSLKKSQLLEYGQKHFMWWVDSPYDENKLIKLKYNSDAFALTHTDHCLFVVVVRHPYDWLRSFYLNPFHVHQDLLDKGFFHFISSEWKLSDEYHELDGQYSEIDNTNPITQKPFKNILEMRSVKNDNYIKLGRRVKNFLLVRYEDVRDNPELFLDFVSEFYRLEKTGAYYPINTHKGSHVPYVKGEYFTLTHQELEYINHSLDWDLERKIGYFNLKFIEKK